MLKETGRVLNIRRLTVAVLIFIAVVLSAMAITLPGLIKAEMPHITNYCSLIT